MCWANQQHSPAHYPVAWCLKQKHNITQSKEEAARRDASDSSQLKNESMKWGLFFFDINLMCVHFANICAWALSLQRIYQKMTQLSLISSGWKTDLFIYFQ